MIVGARLVVRGISDTDPLGLFIDKSPSFIQNGTKNPKTKQNTSTEQQICRQNHLMDKRGQKRMARLIQPDRKTVVTQITSLYNRGEQKSNSEHTTQYRLY